MEHTARHLSSCQTPHPLPLLCSALPELALLAIKRCSCAAQQRLPPGWLFVISESAGSRPPSLHPLTLQQWKARARVERWGSQLDDAGGEEGPACAASGLARDANGLLAVVVGNREGSLHEGEMHGDQVGGRAGP